MQTETKPTIAMTLTPEQACTLLEAIAVFISAADRADDLREIWRQAVDGLGALHVELQGANR